MPNVNPKSLEASPLSVGFTRAQRVALKEAAAQRGLKMANFTRRATVNTLIDLGLYDPKNDPDTTERFFPLKET